MGLVHVVRPQPVAAKVGRVEELARVVHVVLIQPCVLEREVLMGVDVVAELAPAIRGVVVAGDQRAVAGAIIAADPVAKAAAIAPVLAAARYRSRPLTCPPLLRTLKIVLNSGKHESQFRGVGTSSTSMKARPGRRCVA